jgi:hypothetical protein
VQSLQSKMDSVQRRYFRALIIDCSGSLPESAAAFDQVVPALMANRKYASLAVYSAWRLAALYRSIGDRAKAADAFVLLVDAWKLPGSSAKDFGESEADFHLRQINDTLWAARYVALVGKSELAEKFAVQALKVIDESGKVRELALTRNRRKLSEFSCRSHTCPSISRLCGA